MGFEYDRYLKEHMGNVKKGYEWIQNNIPTLINHIEMCDLRWQITMAHDQSKYKPDEYGAYDAYFYGGNRSFEIVQDFQKAWLLHIHRNPHHWQHWILINDDPEEGTIYIEMPYNYVVEMICDWWAFSWRNGDLWEIFTWYDDHKAYIKLHPNTRKVVEDILNQIKIKLTDL